MAAEYLTLADLDGCITRARVLQYLDDDGDGLLDPADPNLVGVLEAAEGMASTRMLRSLPRENIVLLALNDTAFRKHVAWVACELACERRVEFLSSEGHGAYWAQYERALKEIDILSKGGQRSVGEAAGAGALANSGGRTSAHNVAPTFAVSPSRDTTFGPNGGQGGF